MRAVLTFHSIDDSDDVLSFRPQSFRALLASLADRQIPVLTFDELSRSDHGITITFDDGIASVFHEALPALAASGLRAHLFLTTGSVGRDNRWPSQPAAARTMNMLSWSQLEACAKSTFLLESHTHTHPDLRTLNDAEIIEEIRVADDVIERRFGRRPQLFAYPYGRFDARVRGIVSSSYVGCFTTRLDYLRHEFDPSEIPRLDTYYLRSPRLLGDILSHRTRAYLHVRSAIRALVGRT